MIDIFREENLAGGRGEMTETLDFMNQQLAERQKELEAAEQRRLAFEAQHPEMVQGGASGLQRLEASRSELRGIDADLAAAQSALAAINGQLAGTPQTLAGAAGPMGGAQAALSQAQAELAGMRARGLTDNHPDVIALRTRSPRSARRPRPKAAGVPAGCPIRPIARSNRSRAERQANVQSLNRAALRCRPKSRR